jgi:hypothetical protein
MPPDKGKTIRTYNQSERWFEDSIILSLIIPECWSDGVLECCKICSTRYSIAPLLQ